MQNPPSNREPLKRMNEKLQQKHDTGATPAATSHGSTTVQWATLKVGTKTREGKNAFYTANFKPTHLKQHVLK